VRFRLLILGAMVLFALGPCGCANAPGHPGSGEMPVVPSEVSDFGALYQQNCAGCHGAEGKGGAAIALANPVYLAIADETILRRTTTSGIPGTSMPAFAQSAGGMLTAKQIDVIVTGIRERWQSRMSSTALTRHRMSHPSPAIPCEDRKSTQRIALHVTAPGEEAGKRQARSWRGRSLH